MGAMISVRQEDVLLYNVCSDELAAFLFLVAVLVGLGFGGYVTASNSLIYFFKT